MNPQVARLVELAAEVPPEQLAEVLAQECPDPAVRAEVAALLKYADEAESYFDNIIQGAPHRWSPDSNLPRRCHRQLLHRAHIGQGGIGTVYLAERRWRNRSQVATAARPDSHRAGWLNVF